MRFPSLSRKQWLLIGLAAVVAIVMLRKHVPIISDWTQPLNQYLDPVEVWAMEQIQASPILNTILSGGAVSAVVGYLSRRALQLRDSIVNQGQVELKNVQVEAQNTIADLTDQVNVKDNTIFDLKAKIEDLNQSYGAQYLAQLQESNNIFIKENVRIVDLNKQKDNTIAQLEAQIRNILGEAVAEAEATKIIER